MKCTIQNVCDATMTVTPTKTIGIVAVTPCSLPHRHIIEPILDALLRLRMQQPLLPYLSHRMGTRHSDYDWICEHSLLQLRHVVTVDPI